MKNTVSGYKRSCYFIDKPFQVKYILLTVLLLLVYTFLFVAIIFSPYIIPLYFDYPMAEQIEASKTLLLLHNKVWPAIAVVIFVLGTLSIFVTHKIAGPIYRFKIALTEIAGGNLSTKITLRKWDDLQDVAGHLNLLTEELRTFVAALKADYGMLSDYINELEREIEAKVISEQSGRETIQKVQAARKNIEEALDRYKIQH